MKKLQITHSAPSFHSNRWYAYFLLFLLFPHFTVSAQDQEKPAQTKSSAIITLESNATVFSTDEEFNRQISGHKIIIQNASVSKVSGKSVTATVIKGKSSAVKTLKQEVKKLSEEKKNSSAEKVAQYSAPQSKDTAASGTIINPAPLNSFSSANSKEKFAVTERSNHNLLAVSPTYKVETIGFILNHEEISRFSAKDYQRLLHSCYAARPPPVV